MKKQILLGVFISLMLMVLPTNVTSAFADEVVIQLMEVVGMTPLPGEGPLDNPDQSGHDPTRPTDFHATINGYSLSITKQNAAIPSAQAIVVNASTGGVVVNEQFTTSLQEQISNAGVYVLHIETEGGALVGQFVVQ